MLDGIWVILEKVETVWNLFCQLKCIKEVMNTNVNRNDQKNQILQESVQTRFVGMCVKHMENMSTKHILNDFTLGKK